MDPVPVGRRPPRGSRFAFLVRLPTWVGFLSGLLLVPPPSPLLGQELPPGYEEGFFELFMERIPSRTTLVTAVDSRGEVLIPLRPVAALAGIPLRLEAGRLVLEWPAGVWRTEVDPATGSVTVGQEAPRIIQEGARLLVGGEFHLTAPALASLLQAEVTVRWPDLTILVTGTQTFPAARRLQLESDRELRGRGGDEAGPDPFQAVPYGSRTGGGAASWGLAVTESQGETLGSLRLALGGSVLGGATEVGLTTGFGDLGGGTGSDDRFARYTLPVHGTGWLRRVEVGSVLSGGTVNRRVVGGTLTNHPFTQPRYFGEAAIAPVVPAGWEYEVYQGDRLVGVSDALGTGEVRAPLNYGNTPVRIRLLGPAGQEVVEEVLYVVSPGQIPTGEWRYDLGGGRCRDLGCTSYAYGEVLHGLQSWLTVGLGVDRLAPETGGAGDTRPYGSLVVRPTAAAGGEIHLQPGSYLRAGGRYLHSTTTNLTGSYAWNRPRGQGDGFRGWQAEVGASSLLPLPGGPRSGSLRLLLRGADRDRMEAWRLGGSAALGRTFLALDYESGLQSGDLLTVRTFTPVLRREEWLRDLTLSTGVGMAGGRGDLVEAGVSFRPVPWGSVQAGVRLRTGDTPQLSVGFVSRSRGGYLSSRAVSGSRSSFSISADGGVALQDREWDPLLLPHRGVGQAGVAGEVFLDLNGNGRRDPGEPPVEGAMVTVGGQRIAADQDGRFRLWEVQPYQATVAAVDSLSVDFDLVPSPREVVIRPAANVFNRVELPLVRTRELAGRVEGPGGRSLAGVAVEVVDREGQVMALERTFSDGEFYFQRVPPGSFTLRVADSSLQALGLCGGSEEVVLPVLGNAVVVAPPLRLREEC